MLRLFFASTTMFFAAVLLLPWELDATTCTTVASGAWSTPSVWASGVLPLSGDTAIISAGDSVWLDKSTQPLGKLVVQGTISFRSDTLYLIASAHSFDTLVTVQGTLDADSGWFHIGNGAQPIVHVLAGGRFRTSAAFPYPSPSMFDSSKSPLFVLDVASTFEYYSQDLELTDVSYFINNIIGHAYQDLTLTGVVASFKTNALTVDGTFHIGYGASTKTEYTPQTVTLSGDVMNDNEGPSGAPGAGRTGCGMLSLGLDTWIFDATHGANIKDTIHWSGPSQLGNVIVKKNTVLSVRFLDDAHCDSLDILTSLSEESLPCGGHLIGRAFSEISVTLDSTNPVDSFYGLGLTIRSGTNPYLGLTRVVRTSGYIPPNATVASASSSVVPALRYYRISTGAGPQTGTPNEMTMHAHCDELNGADPTGLHFWRSLDDGETWAYSGLTSSNTTSDVFVWDTTVLAWPNATGSFLWMLADGYTDSPLPVVLENFTANRSGSSVALAWQTSSENNVIGFELDRAMAGDSQLIASYWGDDALRARSQSGAMYHYTDAAAPAGAPRYDLFEITDDGARQWLASSVANGVDSSGLPMLASARYNSGLLILSFNGHPAGSLSVVDAIGRSWLQTQIPAGEGDILMLPMTLPVGFYIVSCRAEGGVVLQKLLVSE